MQLTGSSSPGNSTAAKANPARKWTAMASVCDQRSQVEQLEAYVIGSNEAAQPDRRTYECTPTQGRLANAPPRTSAEQH